jgi:hypothetical protein
MSGSKGAIDGPIYTVKEASALYFQGKISPREGNALFNAGELRGCRVGRKILIYKWSLDEYTTRMENFGGVPLILPRAVFPEDCQ